ncbi:MAG: hypothetical protein O3B82_04435 [Bacteroidetes bacterium]|nr:hypothetical protein [Bacteroidota bacterium]
MRILQAASGNWPRSFEGMDSRPFSSSLQLYECGHSVLVFLSAK